MLKGAEEDDKNHNLQNYVLTKHCSCQLGNQYISY